MVASVKQAAASQAPAAASRASSPTAQSALQGRGPDAGLAPEFLKRFPDDGRAGAWREFRDVQLSPTTALSGKNKELIGLAVASQIPCRFCVIAHTEFAKLNGATDAEITEAIGMAASPAT